MQQLQDMIQRQTMIQSDSIGNTATQIYKPSSSASSRQNQVHHALTFNHGSDNRYTASTNISHEPQIIKQPDMMNQSQMAKQPQLIHQSQLQTQPQMTSMNYSFLNYDGYNATSSRNNTSQKSFGNTSTALPVPPAITGQQNITLNNESAMSSPTQRVTLQVIQHENEPQEKQSSKKQKS